MLNPQLVRVLVVDDDEAEFRRIQRLLTAADTRPQRAVYTVDWADSVAEARARLRSSDYDVVMVDYHLHGDDLGVDLVVQLRREGCTVPVVLITGRGGEAVEREAVRVGCYEYVLKEEYDGPNGTTVLDLVLSQGAYSHGVHAQPEVRAVLRETSKAMLATANTLKKLPDLIASAQERMFDRVIREIEENREQIKELRRSPVEKLLRAARENWIAVLVAALILVIVILVLAPYLADIIGAVP